MTEKFGMTSWDEVEFKSNNFTRGKDQYMRLDGGSNRMRIVTRPAQYHVHAFKEEGDAGFGEKIRCSFPAHNECPLCAMGSKQKNRWFVGIIDRKTQTYKILDIGQSVFKEIQAYSRNEDWGDPMKYDIDLVVDKKGGASGYYKVIAIPAKPLTEADLAIKKDIDHEYLQKKCTPPTPLQVQEDVDRYRAKRGKGPMSVSSHTAASMASGGGGEDEMDFPAVN
mgnify:CR=1 FL=1